MSRSTSRCGSRDGTARSDVISGSQEWKVERTNGERSEKLFFFSVRLIEYICCVPDKVEEIRSIVVGRRPCLSLFEVTLCILLEKYMELLIEDCQNTLNIETSNHLNCCVSFPPFSHPYHSPKSRSMVEIITISIYVVEIINSC